MPAQGTDVVAGAVVVLEMSFRRALVLEGVGDRCPHSKAVGVITVVITQASSTIEVTFAKDYTSLNPISSVVAIGIPVIMGEEYVGERGLDYIVSD